MAHGSDESITIVLGSWSYAHDDVSAVLGYVDLHGRLFQLFWCFGCVGVFGNSVLFTYRLR